MMKRLALGAIIGRYSVPINLAGKATLILSLSLLAPWLSAEETPERLIPLWAARANIPTFAAARKESALPETIPYGQRLSAIVSEETETQPLTKNDQGVEGRYLRVKSGDRAVYVFSADVSLFPLDSRCTSLSDWAKRFGGYLISKKHKGCTDEELLWKNCDSHPNETILTYDHVTLQIISHSEMGAEILSLPGGRRLDAFFVGESCMPAAVRSKLDASKLTIADDESPFCQAVGQMPAYTLKLEKANENWRVFISHSYGGLCQ